MNSEPRDTLLLFVREELGLAHPSEFISWATAALVAGFDSPSLRLLAGLDLSVRSEVRKEEVDKLHQQALREIGISPPSRDVLLRWHLRSLAAKICNGKLKIREGLDLIHREVVGPLNHADDVRSWCLLRGAWNPDESRPYTESELEARVMRAATKLLSSTDDSGQT